MVGAKVCELVWWDINLLSIACPPGLSTGTIIELTVAFLNIPFYMLVDTKAIFPPFNALKKVPFPDLDGPITKITCLPAKSILSTYSYIHDIASCKH